MISAALFDFDNTLAATDAWKPKRQQLIRSVGYDFTHPGWLDYFADVVQAEPCDALEGPYVFEIVDDLIRSGVPVAIVTTSPRRAVIEWFANRCGYEPPVVIGFEDTAGPRSHKPHAAPLVAALSRLGIVATPQVVSVGDDWRDVLAAHRAGITSATFDVEARLSAAPDCWLEHSLDSADWLATHSPGGRNRYVVSHDGQVVGGRYHADGGHVHDLIWQSKSGTWPNELVDAATYVVAAAAERLNDPVLVTIPPHEGDDRFAALRATVAHRLGITTASLLKWTRPVGSLHSQRLGPAARRNAVRGALQSPPLPQANVVVLDDVLTTGSTLAEARRALEQAGATCTVAAALTATLSNSAYVDHGNEPLAGFAWPPGDIEVPQSIPQRQEEAAKVAKYLAAEDPDSVLADLATNARARQAAELERRRIQKEREEFLQVQRREHQRELEAERRRRREERERKQREFDAERAEARRQERERKQREFDAERAEARRQELRKRAEEATDARASDDKTAKQVSELMGTWALLGTGTPERNSPHRTANGQVMINRVLLLPDIVAEDAITWVRKGRPDSIEAFRLVDRRARLALLRVLQAAGI